MTIDVLDRGYGLVRVWCGAGLGREIYNPQNSGPRWMGLSWYRARCGTVHCEPRDALDPACLSSFVVLPLQSSLEKTKRKRKTEKATTM